MSEVKHTPGPWSYSGDDDGDFVVWGPGRDEFLANVDQESFGPVPPMKVAFDINQANARLIAAAPDLLEALVVALPWLSEDEVPSLAAKQLVKAAIRKARGETHD
jgi:hypothetical protein